MSADTLQALISDLEGATGPDWRINHDIAVLMGWRESRPGVDYTGSVDAALKLVPPGHDWLRRSFTTMSVVRALTPDEEARKEWAVHYEAAGATPAIALCIASLKARDADV